MSGFVVQKIVPVISFTVILLLALVFFQPAGLADPFLLIEDELSWLSLKEDEIFQELFTLSMTLDNLERETETLVKEIEQIEKEIRQLEREIGLQEQRHQQTVRALAQVLRTYQRMGPASYVEIILDSKDLSDFLGRINLVKVLAKNTRQLWQTIEENMAELNLEKEKHLAKLAELTAKQEEIAKIRAEAISVREQLAEYLLSLEQEKEFYREQLIQMQQTWEQLEPFFAKTIQELAETIDWDKIPQDGVETRISLRGIYGFLKEDTLNKIIGEYPELAGVEFRLTPGQASLILPDSRLALDGIFVIVDKSAISFQVTKGRFYGFPLGQNTIDSLLEDNQLVIDFKPLIGNNELRSIEIREQEVELLIVPVLRQNQS